MGTVLRGHWSSAKTSFLFFFCTLLEEDFSKHIFLFTVGVVILHIVVSWLVEDAVRVMIAVRVFVSNPSNLIELDL